MGTDNLFHKDKARKIETLRRKKAKQKPYDVVLIVCEGEKTERNYFFGLREELRLSSANIKVVNNPKGTDPLNIVDFAINEYAKDRAYYDRIYCVFDKDKHTTFNAAVGKAKNTRLKKKITLHAITSIPCFEIWLLLHYEYTTRSFCAAGNDSNCALVVSKLKTHIPDYEKGNPDIFEKVKSKLDAAISNAKSLEIFHQNSGTDNPSTKVHELIEYLQNLKKT